jgi:hypothetical protein
MSTFGQSSHQIDVYDKLELFFKDPHVPSEIPGDFSTLYLLRKDAWKCYGCDPEGCVETTKVLFPGAMTVFCGVDLLAKFYQGDVGQVTGRFKRYVQDFFPASRALPDLSHHVYGLRNCLMHSFGMRDRLKASGQVTYGIKADQEDSTLLVELKQGEWYVIDIVTLHQEFEASVGEFKKHVLRDSGSHQVFSDMWDRYGSIFFSGTMLSTDADNPDHTKFLYPGYSVGWDL